MIRELARSARVLLPIRRRDRFLNALLGPRCRRCAQRVFPNDRPTHARTCD